jgi:aldose 1-epimerase
MLRDPGFRRRTTWRVTLAIVAWSAASMPAAAARYAARHTGDVVRLDDAETKTVVSIASSVGDIAFELSVNGQNVLHWPFASVTDFKAKPAMSGVPFVGPWANRLDEQAFYANGTRYPFDMASGNVRGAIPIHGFLTTTDRWEIVEVKADGGAAWVTSRLSFFRYPLWMKQWPFAHAIEITHRLHDGVLEVRTTITNMSAEPMPVAIGFHPYFRLTDAPRDEWTLSIDARTHWRLSPDKIPTGETEPIESVLRSPRAATLRDRALDDVFGDLIRDGQGRATMSVIGKSQRVDVVFGPNYRAAVIWAPIPGTFVCIEPMAAITDALNLAQKGIYKELQSIPPGGTWRESFWIRPAGF